MRELDRVGAVLWLLMLPATCAIDQLPHMVNHAQPNTHLIVWVQALVDRSAPQAGLEVDRPDEGHVVEQVLEW